MTAASATPAERDVFIAYPGVAATGVGRMIGRVLNCLPIPLGPATLSQWLFGLPLAPLGAAVYFWQKAFGLRYRLTDRRLIAETPLTRKEIEAAELADVADAVVSFPRVERWFRAGDLTLLDATGTRLMTVRAVPQVENLAARLHEVQGAKQSVAAAAAVIAARGLRPATP